MQSGMFLYAIYYYVGQNGALMVVESSPGLIPAKHRRRIYAGQFFTGSVPYQNPMIRADDKSWNSIILHQILDKLFLLSH